jgi:SAM-dependent methyltransferase
MSRFSLHGDDFSPAQIQQWFDEEREGYFELAGGVAHEHYYRALNCYHAFDRLEGRRFERCLTLGCAEGLELEPIAAQVGEIIAIEPAQGWWSDTICGTPARYMAPNADASIDLPSGHVDLIVCFGVLHHIPNVSAVLRELGRVAAPGALLLIREPHTNMGDWTKPRVGLTRNERGIQAGWMCDTARQSGFEVVSTSPCDFPGTSRIAALMGIPIPYNSPAIVKMDAVLSRMTSFNRHYRRDALWKKVAPSSTFYVLRRRDD